MMMARHLLKVLRVIGSCQTAEQLVNAHTWAMNLTDDFEERELIEETREATSVEIILTKLDAKKCKGNN